MAMLVFHITSVWGTRKMCGYRVSSHTRYFRFIEIVSLVDERRWRYVRIFFSKVSFCNYYLFVSAKFMWWKSDIFVCHGRTITLSATPWIFHSCNRHDLSDKSFKLVINPLDTRLLLEASFCLMCLINTVQKLKSIWTRRKNYTYNHSSLISNTEKSLYFPIDA